MVAAEMSLSQLPTPPSTGHREKENRVPLSKTHVIWSPHNEYRTIKPIPQVPAATSASKNLPKKSILKKRSEPLLPFVEYQREETPEPSRPKFDPTYLTTPVKTIIDSSACLEDLIRAYSVLAARIRNNVTLTTDSDTSYPLLEPLRKNRVALEEAVVRDLGRCLVDPETMDHDQTPEDKEEEACLKKQPPLVLPPSPKNSPKKKKKGTTAKKSKLLAVVFTLPAVSGVFTVPQLRSILTQVLAIPLADELPTPNARKTYALSIWLLQTQRLPAVVLESAADRIAFALRRGIEGELGKEGKKGSASDGLKAIHDLSVYQPSIFVPRFEALLPSVLTNLLALTAGIRAQACHALGGFARGLATLPVSALHTRISAIIVSILTTPSSPSKNSPTKSSESALARTIRTTLLATEVQNVSQGPVWGLSVVAALLVLGNSAVYAHKNARQVFIALLSCAMNHKKSTVRSLGSAVWRCALWAYCQPLLPGNGDDESEVDEEENSRSKLREIQQGREKFWTEVVATVVDMGVGISTVAALLEEGENSLEDTLTRVAGILKFMTGRGGANYLSAVETLARIVSFEPPETEWTWNKLLPRGLFSASPGLLTAEFNALETPVRSIIAQCPDADDVRSLTREEVAQPAIFSKLVEMWRECLGYMGLQDEDPIPSNILLIWDHLVQGNAAVLQDGDNPDEDTAEFANQAADILIDVLLDSHIDVTLKAGEVRFCTDGQTNLSNAALKVKVVRALWAIMRKGEKLLCELMKAEDEFTDSGEVSRAEWAMFCAEVLIVCDPDYLGEFWNYSKWEWTDAIRSTVWRCFVEKWKEESECAWQAIVTLLLVPFSAKKSWELSDPDYELWDAFLGHGIDKALDYGLDEDGVLNHVASFIVKVYDPTSTTASRVAESLLEQLEKVELRELPESLFELVNDTLRSSYPPEPRNKQRALWTLRSLQRAIENCPPELVVDMLRLIEDGLCTWVSDEHQALSEADYDYDVVNLYQVILMKIRALPLDLSVLESVGTILESGFVGRENTPAGITGAFSEFWSETYTDFPVPEEGWPAEIQTCLGVPDEVDQLDHDEPWGNLSLSPPFRGAQKISADGKAVPIGFPFKLRNACFRSASLEPAGETGSSASQEVASDAMPCRPITPTTPVTVRSRASTPPRPHKLPTAQSSPTSPDSPSYSPYPPSTPSTPKRTPPLRLVSPSKASSPNKRRKLDNKENESPRLVIASVMERIIASPRSGHDLATMSSNSNSKKHVSPNLREGERPSKRSKMDVALPGDELSFRPRASGGEDAEEERFVEFSLVEQQEQSAPSPTATGFFDANEGPTPPSKKRKRVVFDAVEVPSVRQVYSRGKDTLPLPFATPSKQNPTKTRLTSQVARRALAPGNSLSGSRKRRRDSDDPFSDNSVGSRRQSSSSDDDIYFGQVTPYHVFSPALRDRRGARDDDPPSSDDSNDSNIYQGLSHAAGQDPDVDHTYGYLGTPKHNAFKASDDSVNTLAPRRATKPMPRIPPSRKKLWAPALTIVGSLIAGCLFAVGHHTYFSSLNGKPVNTTTVLSGLKVFDEKWANHVAVALAFLTKFFFCMCVGAAYVETLWKTARRPLGLSVAGLDASFSLLSNPTKFLSTDLLFSAQFLLLLAAISWLTPFVAVFTPGALTVVQQFVNETVPCVVPALNLASTYAVQNLGSYSDALHAINGNQGSTLSGPKQALQRIATTTLLDGTYTVPTSPCVTGTSVCSYSTSYVAPYFKCGDPVGGAYTDFPNFEPSGGRTWFNATYIQSTSTGDQLLVAWQVNYTDVYVLTCSAMNATYAVNIQHTPEIHEVEVSSVATNAVLNTDISLNVFTRPLTDPVNSVALRAQIISAAVMGAVANTISGSVVASDPQSGSIKTIITDTLVGMSNFGVIDEDEQARNFTAAPDMPGLVTSLLQNVTIGLMASNVSDVAVSATCVQALTQNFYLYHPTTLWPPYAAALVAALVATFIGLSSLWANKTAVDTSFTAMIEVTRNSALDAVPGQDPARLRLRYGAVNDGGEERMAFGQLRDFGDQPLRA
ncbi:hypothetical protein MVEN_00373800 [Mycena venus]|uniref:Telomere-associated protein Rif1 N-terminal domain-containing protein n=1 Tax=Mycena venus TaxID=2733690 RepID=A0A8H6YTQ9_9AGAR|nr:hypothetical protein MVEN_00373800 [Mycena venus]